MGGKHCKGYWCIMSNVSSQRGNLSEIAASDMIRDLLEVYY